MVGLSLAPWLWVRLLGLMVGTAIAMFLLRVPSVLRGSDSLVGGEPVSMASGGWLLLAAGLLACAGVIIAATRFQQQSDAPGRGRSRKGLGSLLLGLAAPLLVGIAGPAAVAVGRMALDEQHAAQALKGRRSAQAGIVIGGLAVTLWFAGLLVAALIVHPSSSAAASKVSVGDESERFSRYGISFVHSSDAMIVEDALRSTEPNAESGAVTVVDSSDTYDQFAVTWSDMPAALAQPAQLIDAFLETWRSGGATVIEGTTDQSTFRGDVIFRQVISISPEPSRPQYAGAVAAVYSTSCHKLLGFWVFDRSAESEDEIVMLLNHYLASFECASTTP